MDSLLVKIEDRVNELALSGIKIEEIILNTKEYFVLLEELNSKFSAFSSPAVIDYDSFKLSFNGGDILIGTNSSLEKTILCITTKIKEGELIEAGVAYPL